jgi:hypothetical protein
MNKISHINRVVIVTSSLGPVDRRVVADLGDILLVCRQEEYEVAKLEGRDPITIGVRRSDMITT